MNEIYDDSLLEEMIRQASMEIEDEDYDTSENVTFRDTLWANNEKTDDEIISKIKTTANMYVSSVDNLISFLYDGVELNKNAYNYVRVIKANERLFMAVIYRTAIKILLRGCCPWN